MHHALSCHLAQARTAALRHRARSDTWTGAFSGTAQAAQPAVAGGVPVR
jgi:hypothetical protein